MKQSPAKPGSTIKVVQPWKMYRIDLGSMKMEAISENEYPRHMIPLISWKDEIWALEGEASASGKEVIFIEVLDDDGEVKRRIDMEEIINIVRI